MQKFLIAAVLTVVLVAAAFFSSASPAASPAPQGEATSTVPAVATATPAASAVASTTAVVPPAAPAVVAPKPTVPVTPAPAPAVEPVAPNDPNAYTSADVAAHGTEADCWTSINGNVYDVTAFFGHHPGGDRNILKLCGKDGTAAFERQHGGSGRANSTLDGFIIGTLVN